MIRTKTLLKYALGAVEMLQNEETFDGKHPFRKTQKEALEAYREFLNRTDLTDAQKLKGFFEMPTGTGKTALFVSLIDRIHKLAENDGKKLKAVVLVPTEHLLTQTLREFEKYAPGMRSKIGLYGGGHKDLSHPTTIIVNNSFVDLIEDGTLGSKNIDLKIADEGHRVTSARRVEGLRKAFNGHTLQLAFTATAKFDRDKTLSLTHENQIFQRSIAEVIREGGELARYIHTQVYVVAAYPGKGQEGAERVEGDNPEIDSDEDGTESAYNSEPDEYRAAIRRQIRRDAYNSRAVAVYRDAVDEITGDHISDNQAAFFTMSTRQADDLTVLLNADEKLATKALAKGCNGVAVVIHSKMPRAERARRFHDYKHGKYMAIVGDDMFKEGFDHKSLKTIIDCAHMSLVDKLQIIGRGARRWKNPEKNRYEGLSVIDIIVYNASHNASKEQNDRARREAVLRAKLAKDVLGDVCVLGKGVTPPERKKPPGKKSLFIPNQNVETYADLESVKNFMQEREDMKDEFKFTDYGIEDILDSARATLEATGKRPTAKDGIIQHGRLAGKISWASVSQAIRCGVLKSMGYKSLSDLFGKENIGQDRVFNDYTIADIIDSGRATFEATGKRPTKNSGKIEHGYLAGKTTWVAVDAAIRVGYLKNKGYKSLPDLLDKNGISKSPFFTDYTIGDIMDSARATLKAIGKRPTKVDGKIKYGQLAGKAKWITIDSALGRGHLKSMGYESLSDLLYKEGIGSNYRFTDYTVDDMIHSARSTLKATGRRPTTQDGEIKYGRLAGKTTWNAANSSVINGHLKNKGYKSLPDLLDKKGVGSNGRFTDYTIDDVINSARATLKATGKRPTNDDRKIKYGQLDGKTTWVATNRAITTGHLKNHGYKSLPDLLDKHGIGIKNTAPPSPGNTPEP